MKPIRLQVQMPTIGLYSIRGRSAIGEVEQLTETMVVALRRVAFKGVLDEQVVRALAFVPDVFRPHLRSEGRLIDGEYVWGFAKLADNKKSLAPFMASGDREWIKEEEEMADASSSGNESADMPNVGTPLEIIKKALGQMLEVSCGPAMVDKGFGLFTVDNCIQIFSWKYRIENALLQLESEGRFK